MVRKGEITVFLCLSMTVIISLLLAILRSDIDKAMRMRTENAMDMGMQSVFAEYNKALLEQYDLYFIDSSYCTANGDAYYTAKHLKDYMSYNVNPGKGQLTLLEKDLFNMSVEDVKILIYSLATDNNAAVYKRQAISAVKNRYGGSIIDSLKANSSSYESSGIKNYELDKKRQSAREKMFDEASKAKDSEGNSISFDDPTKDIENKRSGIIGIILKDTELSNASINNSSLPTNRSLKTGDGIVECHDNLDSLVNNLLFTEYLGWKFACYTNDLGKEGIKYELEYILKNKNSDIENLKGVIKDLLLLRETANVIYLNKDPEKKNEAKVIATALAAVLKMPDLAKVIEEVIIFSWGFAESCVDIKTLLEGGKVPIMKDNTTWVLSLTKAMNFRAHLKDGLSKSKGLDYVSYLKIFLMLENQSDKVFRSLDVIEKNICKSKNNNNFKIDNCIEYLDAEAVVIGRYGYRVSIRRYFGYVAMPRMSY